MKPKIRTRRTQDRLSLHPFMATIEGVPIYGWGHTRKEARERLIANLQRERRIRARDRRKGRKNTIQLCAVPTRSHRSPTRRGV